MKAEKCKGCGGYKPITCYAKKKNGKICGHTWTPKQDEVLICSKCKSARFEKPKGK